MPRFFEQSVGNVVWSLHVLSQLLLWAGSNLHGNDMQDPVNA